MKRVIDRIDERTAEYARHPLFAFLRDRSIDPDDRLALVPGVAHFVVTFSDICTNVLREEPARDRLQEIVNRQTQEEEDHVRWFFSDLGKLGYDPSMRFSESLRYLWSDETRRARVLAYKLCRHGFGAPSLHKIVVVHCAEATSRITVSTVAAAGADWGEKHGAKLAFFGAGHQAAEEGHTLWDDALLAALRDTQLDERAEGELIAIVDDLFGAFTAFADQMLETARAKRGFAAVLRS